MTFPLPMNWLTALGSAVDPRRSLAAGLIWLVVALTASFAMAASLWVGEVAREIVVQQHVRRLVLETEQFGSDLGRAMESRLTAARAAGNAEDADSIFSYLTAHYPRVGWIAVADFKGVILDAQGIVRIGPREWLDRPWSGTDSGDPAPFGTATFDSTPASARPPPRGTTRAPHFERLPNGVAVLVARAPLLIESSASASPAQTGWQVQLIEAKEQVYQRADALAQRILWISLTLGAITALAGVAGARHLTNRLRRLTRSAVAVGSNEFARIQVPRGRDEVASLAAAFAKVLDDLRQERRELLTLSEELERRVAVRTREVERLAEESRYAAVVRERLKIARDLHDTLAHSMMAMLSEVRLLRKLHQRDPASLMEELEHAEEIAHEGLNEARTAITQMRVNAVRDTGLGAALTQAIARFSDRSGLPVQFTAEQAASSFGDERAEAVFRMAEEALRNIERHAMARQVGVELQSIADTHVRLCIADDGVGFDPGLSRPGHYGLVGLREQALLIDARLEIESTPGAGTRITIVLRTRPEIL